MTTEFTIKLVLDAWHSKIKEAGDLLDKLTDEQLQMEISPNRNRGIYLLGHLTAVHDRMLPLLGWGQRFYPQLDECFISNPDKAKTSPASAIELREYWKKTNSTLAAHINNVKTDEWFQKHSAVSAEDFIKEPHRNKLNIMINRTNHLAYHTGQLALLKK